MEVSVLLPFYNAENTLGSAIESIVQQSLKSWELILVDNASSDQSCKIAEQYAAMDKRIRLLKEPAKGIVPALNTGLQACRGQFIARMDADDVSLPLRLELQRKHLEENPLVDLCASRVKYETSQNNTEGYRLYVNWINQLLSHEDISMNRFIESPFAHPSVMFRMSCVARWGNYKNGDFPEDYELWLRWLSKGACMEKIDAELLVWNDDADRLSRTDDRYRPDAFFLMKMHYLIDWLQNHNPHHPNVVIWGAGKLAKQRAGLLEKLGLNVLFFIDVDKNKCLQDNCIIYTDLANAGKYFVISLAGNRGVGSRIQAYLESKNYIRGNDFIIAAGL